MSALLKDSLDIHTFVAGGKRFAFIVDSLDFFQIDEIAWDVLNLGARHSSGEILGKLGNRYGKGEVIGALNEVKNILADVEPVSAGRDSGDFSPNVMLLQVSCLQSQVSILLCAAGGVLW